MSQTLRPTLVASGFFMAISSFASAQHLVTYFNYNTGASSGAILALPIGASNGNGTLTSNYGSANILQYGGSTLNTEPGIPAGQDIAFQNGANMASEGRYAQFQFNTLSYTQLTFSTAIRRSGITTSPKKQILSWSVDGANFTDIVNLWDLYPYDDPIAGQTYKQVIVDLSSITQLNGQRNAYLRITMNELSSSSAANVRFDNTKVIALLPAPSSSITALFGGVSGGFLLLHRQKKMRK